MTEFERNARYSYDEKLTYLKQLHDSQHLQTMSYGGYDVIMLSVWRKGLTYFFYKDGKLVKMRRWNWKRDIRLYAKKYIDNELNARKKNSMKYINVDNLKEEIKKFSVIEYNDGTFGDDIANGALDYVLEEIIPSLQQEQKKCC